MRILVTGVKGQLGHDVVNELKKRGHTPIGVDVEEMDITDSAAVEQEMKKETLDAVIHCAAYTAVDAAEDNREICMRVNAEGTRNIARVCRELDIKMIYISTDYVFDGYSVGALGYLMKPPKPDQLDGVLDRAAEARLREGDQAFLCRSGETLYRIPKKSILYFASDRRQVTCVSAVRTYTFYGKLDDVERDVGEGFVRVHQRYLVRAGAVDRMEGTQVFVGGEALPVSRACRSAALAALARTALEG